MPAGLDEGDGGIGKGAEELVAPAVFLHSAGDSQDDGVIWAYRVA